jgi:ribosomal protein S27AE
LATLPGAKLWIRNGPDTRRKLLKLRAQLDVPASGPEFFIMGRARMRMGFHWRPAFIRRKGKKESVGVCPRCGKVIADPDGNPCSVVQLEAEENRRKCRKCGEAVIRRFSRPGGNAGMASGNSRFAPPCRDSGYTYTFGFGKGGREPFPIRAYRKEEEFFHARIQPAG